MKAEIRIELLDALPAGSVITLDVAPFVAGDCPMVAMTDGMRSPDPDSVWIGATAWRWVEAT